MMILKKAIYGLKTAENSWHVTLSKTLEDIGFKQSIGDPDVWTKPAKDKHGDEYYQWILCYVDDLLVISYEPHPIMTEIGKVYDLKDTVKAPEQYLGANISKWQLPDGREVWAMSGKDYVKNAVRLAKGTMERKGLKLPTRKSTERPMRQDYRPEIDVSPELGKHDTAEY